tara:strand:+ start:65378 stop:65824 length:447 start_codon:yes stop_codon:yes gene_type:complete
MIRNFFCLFVFILFTSCYLVPCRFNSDLSIIDTELEIEVLTGTYKVEKRTIDYIEDYSSGSAEIKILKNGKIIYKNLSPVTIDFFNDTLKISSGKGSWKLIKNNGLSVLIGDSYRHWSFYKKKDDLILSTDYYGDPDSCLFARFKKVN